jgi:hypothetical protein
MRLLALLALALICGCVQPGCLECDDGNPCTSEKCVEGQCILTPLSGPVEGCSGSGSCLEYGCFRGECLPQKMNRCCGNGLCETLERYDSCPRDCGPTCFDGIRNQGEDQPDCGGPCGACGNPELAYLKKVGSLREDWFASASNYSAAVRENNINPNKSMIRWEAMERYSRAETTRAALMNSKPPKGMETLKSKLNDTLSTYLTALNSMVLYANSGEDSYRLESNRLFGDAVAYDRDFVEEYNLQVDRHNSIQTGCGNSQVDEDDAQRHQIRHTQKRGGEGEDRAQRQRARPELPPTADPGCDIRKAQAGPHRDHRGGEHLLSLQL